MIEYDSLRPDLKKKVKHLFGDPYEIESLKLRDVIKPDPKAAQYFSLFTKPDGLPLDEEAQIAYRTTAEIYNALSALMTELRSFRTSRNHRFIKKDFFIKAAEAIEDLPTSYTHTIRGLHYRSLQRNYKKYKKLGYPGIIHGGVGNTNSLIRNELIDRLVISLYCAKNKPYANWVHEDYIRFVTGQIDLVDRRTGELFNPADFEDKNGEPLYLSYGTIWNIIQDPQYQPVIAQYRSGSLEYSSTQRPHAHRHAPHFSLSKISMDDRDLPRKMRDGRRVKAYYSYDVKSGAIIGASYSKSKTADLFIDCMRDMFCNIDALGLGVPLEVEVEHHLVASFRDDLMKAGNIFPFVRWANPGNAQEKWAETGNRLKKYGYEKRYQDGIGRFYAKLEANRTHQDKIFDEENDNYKEKHYDYKRLMADDREMIKRYNNSLHPNQEEYQKMTRLEVLKVHANKNLADIDKPVLAKLIGKSRETHIRRNQYVRVFNDKYGIDYEGIKRLKPNNYEVTAYQLPSDPDTVHLYQGTDFICTAARIVAFNTARGEWTDADEKAYTDQMKYVAAFDADVKRRKKQISKIEILEKDAFDFHDDLVEIVNHIPHEPEEVDEFEELLNSYDADTIIRKARENL